MLRVCAEPFYGLVLALLTASSPPSQEWLTLSGSAEDDFHRIGEVHRLQVEGIRSIELRYRLESHSAPDRAGEPSEHLSKNCVFGRDGERYYHEEAVTSPLESGAVRGESRSVAWNGRKGFERSNSSQLQVSDTAAMVPPGSPTAESFITSRTERTLDAALRAGAARIASVEAERLGDSRCVKVTASLTGGRGSGRVEIWYDTDRGCLPLRVQEYEGERLRGVLGGVQLVRAESDYGPVFYPTDATYERFDDAGEVVKSLRFTSEPGSVRINQPIPEARFTPEPAATDRVLDADAALAAAHGPPPSAFPPTWAWLGLIALLILAALWRRRRSTAFTWR